MVLKDMEEIDLVESRYQENDIDVENMNFYLGNKDSFRKGEDTMFEIKNPTNHEEECNFFSDFKLVEHLNIDSDSDEEDGVTPFEKKANKMISITDDGGVLKRISKPGSGEVVAPNSSVRFHYDAYVEYAEEPFDSTYLRGKPFRIRLGQDQVVRGIELALLSMRMNERAEFLITPNYGFGALGCAPRIPENATLLYKIELLDFNTCSALSQLDSMTSEERKCAPFALIYSAAFSEKTQGNIYLKDNHIKNAFYRYQHGIRLLENSNLANDEEESLQRQLLINLYCNASRAKSLLHDYGRQCFFARKALEIDGKCVKAKYNLAQGLIGLNSGLDEAKSILLGLKKDHKNSKEVCQALEKLERKLIDNKLIEKDFCLKMFKKNSDERGLGISEIKDTNMEASDLFKRVVTAKLETFSKSSEQLVEFSINDSTAEKNFVISECHRLGLKLQTCSKDNLKLKISKTK